MGKEIARKLCNVEIDIAEKLRELGSRAALFRLRAVCPNVCLVHLYALEGAVSDMGHHCLPPEAKRSLKEFCDSIA